MQASIFLFVLHLQHWCDTKQIGALQYKFIPKTLVESQQLIRYNTMNFIRMEC